MGYSGPLQPASGEKHPFFTDNDMVKSFTLQELADLVGGTVSGNPALLLSGFSGIESAGSDEITYAVTRRMAGRLSASRAGAAIIPADCEDPGIPSIRVANPDFAAAVIHNHFLAAPFTAQGIDPSAQIGRDCHIPAEVSIGPLVCIGDRVRIGRRVTLYPGVVVGADVSIGDDTVLHANVSVAERCVIGSRVILHPGAVIGSDGFGYATDRSGSHLKKPQVGSVLIEDDVEIGANSCVDRAAFGTTRIGSGVKIDNLVQIAHNVDIGENTLLVAQAGIAGSTTLGRNVVMGAKSGIAGHLKVGDGTMVAAMAGVHDDQEAGSRVGGAPAIDVKTWGRATAVYNRLPEIYKEVRRLRREVDGLQQLLSGSAKPGDEKDKGK
jgi:UDP-3-O-[3-hydroxymyristoyl] glucosamine N-acyltransferase